MNDSPSANPRPFYYADVRVDPEQSNRLYSLATQLRVSTDGGKTFENLRGTTGRQQVHVDHHALWIDPKEPRRMLLGNDGGMYESRDRGETFRFVGTLPVAQYYHVSGDGETPYNVYRGLQDNNSWRGPSNVWQRGGIQAHHWKVVGGGDGFETLPDREDPARGWSLTQGGYLMRWDVKTGERRDARPQAPEGTKLRFNWNAALAVDPFEPATVWLGSQFVHHSKDRGETWETVSPDLTTNNPEWQKQETSGGLTLDVTAAENYTTLVTIAPSPAAKGTVWTGSDDGRIHVTRDGVRRPRQPPLGRPGALRLPDGRLREDVEEPRDALREGLSALRRAGPGEEGASLPRDGDGPLRPDRRREGVAAPREDDPDGVGHGPRHPPDGGGPHHRDARPGDLDPRRPDAFPRDDGGGARQAAPSLHPGPRAAALARAGGRRDGSGRGRLRRGGAGEEGPDPSRPRVSIRVTDAAGKLVRVFDTPARQGLSRVAWDLGRDAWRRFPRAADAGPLPEWQASGPEVPPGEYTVAVTFKDATASAMVTVLPDPRSKNTAAGWAKRWSAIERAGGLQEKAAEAAIRIRRTRDDVAAVEERLRRKNETLRDPVERRKANETPFAKEAAALKKALTEKESLLWSPPEDAGISARDRLAQDLQSAAGDLASSWAPPSPTHLERFRQAEARLTKYLADLDAFYAKDVAAFREKAAKEGRSGPLRSLTRGNPCPAGSART